MLLLLVPFPYSLHLMIRCGLHLRLHGGCPYSQGCNLASLRSCGLVLTTGVQSLSYLRYGLLFTHIPLGVRVPAGVNHQATHRSSLRPLCMWDAVANHGFRFWYFPAIGLLLFPAEKPTNLSSICSHCIYAITTSMPGLSGRLFAQGELMDFGAGLD